MVYQTLEVLEVSHGDISEQYYLDTDEIQGKNEIYPIQMASNAFKAIMLGGVWAHV